MPEHYDIPKVGPGWFLKNEKNILFLYISDSDVN